MTGGRAALDYAERELGVHSIHEHAEERSQELDSLRSDLANHRKLRSDLEERILDREIELASLLRAASPEASEASIERKLKELKRSDNTLRELRSKLSDCNYTISVLEVDVARTKTQVDIAVARMTELGGYFQYLAAIKQAETKTIPLRVASLPEDWPPEPS